MEQLNLDLGKRILSFTSYIKTIPYKWDWENGGIVEMMEGTELKKYFFMAFLCLGHTAFLATHLLVNWNWYMARDLPPDLFLHVLWTLGIGWIGSLHIHIFFNLREIPAMMNLMVRMTQGFKRQFGAKEYERSMKKLKFSTFHITGTTLGTLMCYLILYTLFPNFKQFLSSLTQNGSNSKLTPGLFCLGVLETLADGSYWCTIIGESYIFLYYVEIVDTTLKLLINDRHGLTPEEQYKIYRSLQLANTIYDKHFGQWILTFMKIGLGMYACTAILGVVKILRTGAYLAVVTMLVFAIFSIGLQMYLYPKAANIFELSTTFARKVHPGQTEHEMAISKSLRPIKLNVIRFFPIKKETTLTFLAIVLNYTISILIG